MARILFGPLVTAIKGSIGGVTFQGNPSGSIIRSRAHLSHVSTNKQTASHADLQKWLYEFQNLTQDQRDQWNTYASVWTKTNKFGEVKRLTGENWFISVNKHNYIIGQALKTVPPDHIIPSAPPSFEIIATASSLSIDFTSAHDFVNNPVMIWASIPTKKNTLSINQIRKYITVLTDAPADPLDITALWESATGLTWDPSNNFPLANIFVCLECISKASGITSPMLCSKSSGITEEEETYIYYT